MIYTGRLVRQGNDACNLFFDSNLNRGILSNCAFFDDSDVNVGL